ncbi:MAG: hypothetical protein ACPGIC_04230 [Opitutales bacterium]
MNTSHLFAPTTGTAADILLHEHTTEAVYRLDGYIQRIEADPISGSPTEWVYVAADGQETGLRSHESAESLRALIHRSAAV